MTNKQMRLLLFICLLYVSRFWSINNTKQIRPPTNLYLLIAYFKQIKKNKMNRPNEL